MKMMNKFCALMLSVALCAGMAAPAFAYALLATIVLVLKGSQPVSCTDAQT